MMSMQTARAHTKSEGAMAVSRRGIEAIAWVLGGGTPHRAQTGHVAASSVPRRRWPRFIQMSLARMAHARHGPHQRPFGPAQIMRRLRRLSLRRCGRLKMELARRHAQTYDLTPEIRGDNRGEKILVGSPSAIGSDSLHHCLDSCPYSAIESAELDPSREMHGCARQKLRLFLSDLEELDDGDWCLQ